MANEPLMLMEDEVLFFSFYRIGFLWRGLKYQGRFYRLLQAYSQNQTAEFLKISRILNPDHIILLQTITGHSIWLEFGASTIAIDQLCQKDFGNGDGSINE